MVTLKWKQHMPIVNEPSCHALNIRLSYDVTITIIHNPTKDQLIHPQDFKSKIQSLIKTNGIKIVHPSNVFSYQILRFHKNDIFWLQNTFHIEKKIIL
jgi:hypothetical protein